VRVKCLAQQHNTMCPARARTRTLDPELCALTIRPTRLHKTALYKLRPGTLYTHSAANFDPGSVREAVLKMASSMVSKGRQKGRSAIGISVTFKGSKQVFISHSAQIACFTKSLYGATRTNFSRAFSLMGHVNYSKISCAET